MSDPDPRWLTQDQWRTWMAVAGLLEALPAALDSQLRESAGINMFEYMILAGLSGADGRTRPVRELATYASGSASRMTHATNRLVSRGWVERVPHPEGRRSLQLHLTDEGMAAMVEIAPAHVRHVRSLIFDVLTDDQARQLGTLALALIDHAAHPLAELIETESSGPKDD